MVLSMGPQHPSTHGVLQIVLEIDGENVVKAEPEIGYLHTGIEKTAEGLFWTQAQTVIERMDYLAPSSNALCYALARRKAARHHRSHPGTRASDSRALDGADAASRRTACGSARTASTSARSRCSFTASTFARTSSTCKRPPAARACIPNYMRVGGVNGDLPDGYLARLDALIEKFPGRMRDLRGLLQANPIFQDRTIDVGCLAPEEALQWGVTGPSLRASGIAYDVRRAFPYTGYDTYDFDVPTRTEGDAYARFLVRLDEMEESHPHHRAGAPAARHAGPGDDRRPEGRAPAEGDDRALDGGADPPLQDHQRGLPRPAGRRVSDDRVAARRAGLLHRQQRREPPLPRAHASAEHVQSAGAQGHRARQSHRRPRRDDRVAGSGFRRGRPMSALVLPGTAEGTLTRAPLTGGQNLSSRGGARAA